MATATTIAILSPGDMGHAVGRALIAGGHRAVTDLSGRSAHTRGLAAAGGLEDLGSLDAVVAAADLVLSILPPSDAPALAEAVADAMTRTDARPVYADCNAVSPATVASVAETIARAGASFIDCGIIGAAPGKGTPTRFYVAGPDTGIMEAIEAPEVWVKPLGAEIGRASAMKMCYASLTKGTNALHVAVLTAAARLGLGDEITEEFKYSQKSTLAKMGAVVPFLPADAARWVGEMWEISATYRDAGLPPGFHEGAAAVFELLAQTPFAAETRETLDRTRTLEQAVRVYAETRGPDGAD